MDVGPRPNRDTISDLVERAFRYRGDVTVELADGKSLTGYLFNRNASCSEPFIQLFETGTAHEIAVLYQDIANIRLTGRDAAAAAAKHYENLNRP